MTELVLAIGLFLATHLLSTIGPLRNGLVRVTGQRTFMILYSLLSLAVVAWLGLAYVNAPYIELWPQLPWMRWAPLSIMPVACLLVAAGLSSPNPFSIGAGARKFDPARPGIVAVTRHPVIWGMALWAIAHLVPNGDFASVLLFGLLLLLALIGPASLDHKCKRTLGVEARRRLLANTRRTPLGRALIQIGVWRWLTAGALYAGLLAGHETVIGVIAFPV
ncbi:MAG TPA: NnrU family protein [Rhodospirillales bacterium]|jgi:uncharacterized membrane protein|nr:NnrU family protein [Rhodospirillales bacterium]